MYLLFDECCGRALAKKAEALGHTAERSVDVGVLGRGAKDDEVIRYAHGAGAILVTINRGDFIALARHFPGHAGILLIPSLPNQALLPLFEQLLDAVALQLSLYPGYIFEIDAAGKISHFQA